MELSKDQLRKMTLEEIIKLTNGEQINKESSSSSSTKSHDESKIQSSAESSSSALPLSRHSQSLTHESSSMDKYFLTPQSNNEIVLNKLSLKKIKTVAKKMGVKNYSQYNSKTKLDLIKLILKEELNAGDWINKLSRLNIKKLKSIAEKLELKIKQNSKKTDLVNRISDNVNNENLNTLLNEIGSSRLEELLEETMSKNESTQNTSLTSASHTSIKELRKIAKEKNIKGYSKMKKAELLQKIDEMDPFAFEDSYFTEFSKKPKIKIIETKAEYTKKWKKHKVYYQVILLKEEESSESDLSVIIKKKITAIREGLNEMIKIVKEKTNFKKGDLLNIVVNHKELWNPISTGLSRTTEIDNLLNNIQSILTSNQDLDIYRCTFYAEVVNMPRGATNANRILNIAEDSRTKRSIIQIKNKDNLCCPRAVIVGLTYHTNIILGKEYDHIKHNRPDIIILNKQQKQAYLLDIAVPNSHNITQTYNTKINKYLELSVAMRNLWCLEKISILPLVISATGIVPQSLFKNLKILDLDNTLVVEIQKGILLYSCHIVRKFLNIDTEHNTQQSQNAEARRR
jgi:hypothetical protein